MKILGIIISNENGPTTMNFDFVINDNSVKKGQFVQIKHENGYIIARIDEIYKTNRYFERADTVIEYEKSGNPINIAFPTERWEYLVANCTILGHFNQDSIERLTFPPSPGIKVEEADTNILSKFLGFDFSSGLTLGRLSFHDLEVKLNMTRLLQKHTAILAMSGAGKSHLVSVLIEELLDRRDELGKPAIIVIDPHGEYKKFQNDSFYSRYTKVFDEQNIAIGVSSLGVNQISEFISDFSSAQKRELEKILKNMKTENYDFDEIIAELESSDVKSSTKESLLGWLYSLKNMNIFSKYTRPSIDVLARQGQLSIIDLSEFTHLNEKQIIATYFSRRLFSERRKGRIPPFLLVIEEAHQFCPEGVKREGAISKNIIETIAREGRKFHASLMLVSQRPIHLSTTALSQCNTHIILRVVNPYDIDHIGKSSEGMTGDLLKTLPGLKTGESLIVGEAVNFPVMMKVRQRKSRVSAEEANFEKAVLEYNLKKNLNKKDLEAFK
ncbi:MAG: ATP-binding protein [Candidatus Aenigmatarchaeota archaeon]|nr:ATP-binding protein [Candidatus Aenigmarchaeota archaeon]